MAPGRRYFPAAGRDAFLPLYDPFTRLFGLQRVLTMLVNQAGLQRNYRVLDVGCGTGTLAVLVKHRHPEVAIVGLDPDPKALERARRKAIGAGVAARFERGFADALFTAWTRRYGSGMVNVARCCNRPLIFYGTDVTLPRQ